MTKSKNKVLVIGASGMLGHVVASYMSEQGYDVDTVVNSGDYNDQSIRIDLMNKGDFERFINDRGFTYDYVINAAGILVKLSDERKDIASYINAYLPHQLEHIFSKTKTKVIHYSTDCVFSGKNGPYSEDSFQDGELFYDKSKALGEIINDKDLTLRQSIIGPDINKNGVGLFNWFMSQNGQIDGYSGALWNGVTTIELAKATCAAIEHNLTGLYHLTPKNNISKYELLKIFNDVFGRGLEINEDRSTMNLNKTLIDNRQDFGYKVADYTSMVLEMKEWIELHADLYKHYSLKKSA